MLCSVHYCTYYFIKMNGFYSILKHLKAYAGLIVGIFQRL